MKPSSLSYPNRWKFFWLLPKNISQKFSKTRFQPLLTDKGLVTKRTQNYLQSFTPPTPRCSTCYDRSEISIIPKFLTISQRMSTGLLLNTATELALKSTRLFYISYNSGIFLKDWKTAEIQSVPHEWFLAFSFN